MNIYVFTTEPSDSKLSIVHTVIHRYFLNTQEIVANACMTLSAKKENEIFQHSVKKVRREASDKLLLGLEHQPYVH